jgi:integrase
MDVERGWRLMRGSIRKRGSTWRAVYDEPSSDGTRKQRTKGGFATKRAAQAFLTEQLRRLDTGSYVEPSEVTVRAYLVDEWLPSATPSLRPATADLYERAVRLYLVPELGATQLQALRGGHLNSLYAKLERDGLAPATILIVHTVIRRACNAAVRWGALTRNPAAMADPPKQSRSKATAWTAGELSRFLDAAAADRLAALWRLAATTGMRRGELLGLTWRALDLQAARLIVEQQLTPRLELAPPKSERSRRTVALDPATVDLLRAHRDAQLLERDFAGGGYDDRDLAFCNELGGSIRPQWLSKHFHDHRKAAGIPTGSLHILRHTAATLALTNGVPVHIVAARLGDRPEQILSTYAHLLPQSDELAAERVAAVLVSDA